MATFLDISRQTCPSRFCPHQVKYNESLMSRRSLKGQKKKTLLIAKAYNANHTTQKKQKKKSKQNKQTNKTQGR
jgi:hypothetical protein